MIRLKRALAFLALMCGFVVSAHAANSDVSSFTCACSTTSDFTTAAFNQAAAYDKQDTSYTISSTSTNMTAFVYVTGTYQWYTDPTTGYSFQYYMPLSAIPVDGTGASIAGLSEASQDLIYVANDDGFFGDRDNPLDLDERGNSQFPWTSFICTAQQCMTDSALSDYLNDAIGATWLNTNLADGATVRIFFKDGSEAHFTFHRGQNGQKGTFTWNGDAWDSQGNKIKRDGSANPNTNTAGNAAPGNYTVSAFAPDVYSSSQWSYILRSLPTCVDEEQVWNTTDPAHPVLLASGYHYVPCQ